MVILLLIAVSLVSFHRGAFASTKAPVPAVLLRVYQKRDHLGLGASLSPDGTRMIYIGEDDSLRTILIGPNKEQVLLRQLPHGLDVFSNPSFSPDGKIVAFSASGGTRYYPSDIFTITIENKEIVQLTHSVSLQDEKKDGFAEYFYNPKYSPDGRRICAWRYDGVSHDDSVFVMLSDGHSQETLTSGRPLFWNQSGNAIFIDTQKGVLEYSIASGESMRIKIEQPILGKLAGTDTFAVAGADGIQTLSLEGETPRPAGIFELPAQLWPVQLREENLTLVEVVSDAKADRLLLRYEGESFELLEVVRVRAVGN